MNPQLADRPCAFRPSRRSERIQRARCLFLVVFTIAVASPLTGRSQSLSQLLSGKTIPLSVKLKELNSEWRRITIHTGSTVSGNVSVNVNGNQSGPTSQNNLVGALGGSRAYVTQGQIASTPGHSYLVAYHLPSAGLDIGKLLQVVATKAPPAAAVLTLDTPLPLSLLELDTVGSIEDVRPFDASAEITESENALRVFQELLKGQSQGEPKKSPPPAESETDP